MSLIIKQPNSGKLVLKKNYFPTPSLDLRFAETKSLTDYITDKNLVDHNRASPGTYVGSDGLIKTATTNYLLRSEEFENAAWTAIRAIPDDNTVVAPNGKLTASTFTATDADPYIFQAVSFPAGSYTFSVYIKAKPGNSTNNLRLRVTDATLGVLSSNILTLTTEWQRFQYTVACPNGITQVRIDAPDQLGAAGDVAYLWGAQLEQSSTVGGYIPTTITINSAPRFDHDPETGESLGLLVEEGRVNNVLQSEAVSTSPWQKLGGPTVTPNDAISPRGDLTADLVAGDGDQVFSGATQVLSSLVIGNTYAVSSFVKPNNATLTRIGLFNQATTLWNFYIDIRWSSGVPSTGGTLGSPTDIQYQDYGNGWYRCSFVGTVDTTTPQIIFQPDRENVGASAWIWGVSVESGSAGASVSFPTSYIPSNGSQGERAADVASISGSNFSSWYSQSEGTVFSEARSSSGAPYTGYIYSIGSTFNEAILHYRQVDFQPVARVRKSGVDEFGAAGAGPIWTGTGLNRSALALSSTSGRFASDGLLASVADDTSIALPSVTSMTIGRLGSASYINGTIRRLTYWNQRLPNSTLVNLTNGTQPF